jgi:hypothetical protein
MGYAEGCYNLGIMYDNGESVQKDILKAIELLTKACDMGYAYGCYRLGLMYEYRNNIPKALKMYTKACDMKEERGCKAYAELMEVISLSFKNVYKSL